MEPVSTHVLGIDAGGTKTVCLLADARGDIVGQGRGPGANLQAAGELAVEKAVHAAMEEAIGETEIVPAAIALGIAGADREDDLRLVHAMMRRICRTTRIVVVNDALIALVAGAGDGAGIVIIAGTGSIAYGRNAENRAARAGGWGHIIGDEGSGYWIGREALAAVVREADGRGPATELTGEVLARFGLTDVKGLVQVVYDRELPRASVAALGPIVQQASAAGDAVATRILERAADELTSAARSVAERLDMRGDAFRVVLAGSVFRLVPWLCDEVTRRLGEVVPRADVARLDREPAAGAVTLALASAAGRTSLPAYA